MSQPENEKVYSLGDYVAVCSEITDWFMYVMGEINDASKEVKVRFMKKSGQYILLNKKLEKWFPKSAVFHRCSTSYHPLTIPCVISFDIIDIKSTCDKIKTLDRDFKMDLHICIVCTISFERPVNYLCDAWHVFPPKYEAWTHFNRP